MVLLKYENNCILLQLNVAMVKERSFYKHITAGYYWDGKGKYLCYYSSYILHTSNFDTQSF